MRAVAELCQMLQLRQCDGLGRLNNEIHKGTAICEWAEDGRAVISSVAL
jgi:hypothetical protein